MITKDVLYDKISTLLELIHTRSYSPITLIFLPLSFAEKVSEFSTKCIDLQQRIIGAPDDPVQLLELKKEVLEIELWIRRRIAKNNLFPSLLLIYIGIIIVFAMIRFIDFSYLINQILGVKAPEKLISLGIAGALVYLATSMLNKIDRMDDKDNQLASAMHVTLRFFLAIVVPIILVVLFFKPDGSVSEFQITPELLSFACGYSAKLVVDIFNKIVEKASKMIEAI